MKYAFTLAMACGVISVASAQMSFGFRAGISFSEFVGPAETDAAGMELDGYNFTSGFHIGFSANYAVTDLFGVRGEVLFSQKGTEYTYNGDSYYFLARGRTDETLVFGNREIDQTVSMATAEIPVFAYFRFGAFEVSGGLYGSILMASTGGGTLSMTSVRSSLGNNVEDFDITLQHNYNRDGAGQAGPPDLPVRVDANTVVTSTTTGAYYDYDEKDQNRYNVFDFGLVGGLSFYFNDALYIGGKVTYGFTDLDRNQYDISLNRLNDDNSYIQRDDRNQNLTIQVSIGFLF